MTRQDQDAITIAGPDFEYEFDPRRGTFASIRAGGREFLERGPLLNVWRTPIDNETVGWGAAEADEWYEIGLDRLEHEVGTVDVTEVADGVTRLQVESTVSAPDEEAGFETAYLYHVFGTGDVLLGVRANPNDALREAITHWLPRIGVQLELPDDFGELAWYGEGPQENYPDRNDGTKVGVYSIDVGEQRHYVRPQDYGNRTDVRWAELSADDGAALAAFGHPDVDVSAHDVANLDRARYTYQLRERDGVAFNVDHAVTGVGGTPVQTLPEYRVVPDGPFEFVVGFRPRTVDDEDQSATALYRRRLPYAFASSNPVGDVDVEYDGETGTILASAVARNPGGEERSVEVPLTVDGEVVASEERSLRAGEKAAVAFEYEAGDVGVFEVAVGDEEPSLLTVPHVSLEGEWRFREGDDPSWADPSYDDADWEVVEVPATWEAHSGYTENEVFGWYRKTVELPAEWAGHDLEIPFGKIDDVDETFVNGEKVGQTGSLPGEGYEGAWNVTRRYTVPSDLLEFGDENVLAIRVYDGGGEGGLHDGPLGPITAVADGD